MFPGFRWPPRGILDKIAGCRCEHATLEIYQGMQAVTFTLTHIYADSFNSIGLEINMYVMRGILRNTVLLLAIKTK